MGLFVQKYFGSVYATVCVIPNNAGNAIIKNDASVLKPTNINKKCNAQKNNNRVRITNIPSSVFFIISSINLIITYPSILFEILECMGQDVPNYSYE